MTSEMVQGLGRVGGDSEEQQNQSCSVLAWSSLRTRNLHIQEGKEAGYWAAPLTGPLSTVCNVTTCPQDPPECGSGQELTYTQEKGSCCPNFSCREWSGRGRARLAPYLGPRCWGRGTRRGPGTLSPPFFSGPKLCNYNGTVYGVRAWPRHGAGRARGQVGCPSPSVSLLTSTFLLREYICRGALRPALKSSGSWPPCLLMHFSCRSSAEGRQNALLGSLPMAAPTHPSLCSARDTFTFQLRKKQFFCAPPGQREGPGPGVPFHALGALPGPL